MAFGSTTSALAVQQSTSNALAADTRSLNALKYAASQNDPAAVKTAAKEFESLFMREVMKSMREATMKSGMFESAQENLGNDMLDQQFAVKMSGQSGGLSDLIARQLMRQMGQDASGDAAEGMTSTVSLGALRSLPAASTAQAGRSAAPANVKTTASQADFVQRHADAAARVQADSGLPAAFMLGQAGHETGWGRSEIKNRDGSPSYNLFGIKAGAGWTGKVATVTTTEYVGGVPRKVTAKFRAYDSYEDSFRDYANMITSSPRYAHARAQTGSATAYASALKKAGYATDPAYAAKLGRAIHSAAAVAQDLSASRSAQRLQASPSA
ncbi:flagellar assembly peptidoglycan hydrolase FlgJ [Xylophilus sp.]|uniref:flagellar assembly peptidoglycan hydrolase FlgJ n=1 Tax=Xylophilus sp. TaxID=2653893 RepID=UPI0013B811DC|nr:flagellar assembly peptidoglycan hydrolase FlgJ [Xylophilus sp.]KAF1044618.1 MAG: Peptidoglycan hydrolase FlgJ [Xylophilus sp.]